MPDFNCGYCGTVKTLSLSKYQVRIKQSKSGLLYCNPKCSMQGRRLIKLVDGLPMYNKVGEPITVSPAVALGLEYDDLFRGVLANPEKDFWGLNKYNLGVSSMVSPVQGQTLAEFMAVNPSIITYPVAAMEDGNIVILIKVLDGTATPSAPVVVPPPVQAPAQAPRPQVAPVNPVIPPTSGTVTAVKGAVRPRRWQDDLSRTLAVGDCDAEIYYDAVGNAVGSACQYDAEAVGGPRYVWCFVDQNSGQITFSQNQCNRCQSKGWVSEQNLGYNYDYDKRTGKTQVSWEEYKAGFLANQSKTHGIFQGAVPVAPVVQPAPAPVQVPLVDENDNPFAD